MNELIVSSPDILGGTPVFAGTRVPVDNLIDYLKAGDTLDKFLDDFPSVSREQVVALLGRLRMVFDTFLNWDDPAMDAYDNYDAAKAQLSQQP